jgi:L-threonylcarbamoyladenylate synthase
MVLIHTLTDPRLHLSLATGGIAVIRTDTLYGVVASATNERAVERIYHVKSRQPDKQLIVLISSVSQLFDTYSEATMQQIAPMWPGKNSIILPSSQAPAWLLRGGDSLAYRLPDNDELRALIDQTGPLVAPSANPEGLQPAMTIEEAQRYFGDMIDVYVDGGVITDNQASNVYRLTDTGFEQLR